MKFSVLMSVYKNDSPKFLDEALRSIYENQVTKPDQIVIIIDGPVPIEISNVLENFKLGKESIVNIYPQIENKGLGEALRIGTNYCFGDYIFRMDADDVSHPERFKKQIEFIKINPEIDVLGTGISEFKQSIIENDQRTRICPSNTNQIVKMSKTRNPMNHVTVCIKKTSLLKVGGYKDLKYVEDYYLWVRMLNLKMCLVNLDESLVYVRVGNGFDTRRGKKEQIKSWRTLQKYMVSKKMISRFKAVINMLYINVFVRSPIWFKRIVYKKMLRN